MIFTREDFVIGPGGFLEDETGGFLKDEIGTGDLLVRQIGLPEGKTGTGIVLEVSTFFLRSLMGTKTDIAKASKKIAISTMRNTDLMRLKANANNNVKKVAICERKDFFCGAGGVTGAGLTGL